MLFTQRLDSEKDISVFPLLKQIVLFSLMQNMKEIISQSKHHYRWIAHSSLTNLFLLLYFRLALHLELIWTSRVPGERAAFHFNNM